MQKTHYTGMARPRLGMRRADGAGQSGEQRKGGGGKEEEEEEEKDERHSKGKGKGNGHGQREDGLQHSWQAQQHSKRNQQASHRRPGRWEEAEEEGETNKRVCCVPLRWSHSQNITVPTAWKQAYLAPLWDDLLLNPDGREVTERAALFDVLAPVTG